MRQSVNGILLLDKPIGLSSNAALQRVKRLYNAIKAGHTGSLDPQATGMLPICFGEATKFSQFLLESNKTYHVVASLGATTTTGDTEGEVTETRSIEGISLEQVKHLAPSFLGNIEQVPPMYSAVKVKGKPLYLMARNGIEIERQPRTVTIFSLDILSLQGNELTFDVTCSKGTYIRTLAEDLGKALGCGAHVKELRRTNVSSYGGATMYTLESLQSMAEQGGNDVLLSLLLPIETSVTSYPAVELSSTLSYYLLMGQPIRTMQSAPSPFVRLISDDKRFLGLGEVLPDGRIKPHRLVAQNTLKACANKG